MKKILVPTDFSPCADNAVRVALAIAEKAKAQIIFQHLHPGASSESHVPKPDVQQPMHARQDPVFGSAKAKLEELAINAGRLGISSNPLLVYNKGNDKIEHYIEPLGIDLVVMGSHGATGIRELIIGSQTQRVVRNAGVPVLVIKNKPDKVSFQNIIFASAFHEDLAPSLQIPVQLAALWNGTVHLLYVGLESDKQTKAEVEEEMRAMSEQFSGIDFTHNFITTNDPEWGINHVAGDINPDAIALTTRLKTGKFIFTHSLAESLVNHESLPVLVINPKE